MDSLLNSLEPLHLAAIMGGYLAGAIPFGLLLTRAAGRGDLRDMGSGNVGATNVLRTGSKGLAALTLAMDIGKGAGAVLVARSWGVEMALWAGLFAVLGHDFTFWLRFKGGKGVATTLGVLLAIAWPVGLAACLVWLAVAWLSRYSSPAALPALAAAPAYAWRQADPLAASLPLLLSVLASAPPLPPLRGCARSRRGNAPAPPFPAPSRATAGLATRWRRSGSSVPDAIVPSPLSVSEAKTELMMGPRNAGSWAEPR